MLRKFLLLCGILSSLLSVAMNVYVPTRWEGYSSSAQVVSELSAIGAPTRTLWIALGIPFAPLLAAFACGVWMSARGRRPLQIAAAALLVQSLFAIYWPPMHLRGEVASLSDVLHIVWSVVTLAAMLVAIVGGARALGTAFRRYSIATVVIFVVFGALTFTDAPRLAANQPTPWIGLWERINMAANVLWVSVFAIALWRRGVEKPRGVAAIT